MTQTCITCKSFDMRKHPTYARLGMGVCKARSDPAGTFVTAGYARECEVYQAAPQEVADKRAAFLGKAGT